MPIFEYRCRKCGHVSEFLEKADAPGPHACAECNSRRTEKIFSTFSAQVNHGGAAAPPCAAHCPDSAGGSCPYS